MSERQQHGWAPAVLRDVGADDSGVYVVSVRETIDDGCWSLVLEGTRLRLVLTEQAAHTLGIPADVSFELEMAQSQIDLLRRGLARVLTSGPADTIPPHLYL